MKITIELTNNQVKAVKSYLEELGESTTKSDIRDTIDNEVAGLFLGSGHALSSHYQSVIRERKEGVQS